MSYLKQLNNSSIDGIEDEIKRLVSKRKELELKKSGIEEEIAPQTLKILELITEIDGIRTKKYRASRVLAIKKEQEEKRIRRENMSPREMTLTEIEEALGQKIIIVDE